MRSSITLSMRNEPSVKTIRLEKITHTLAIILWWGFSLGSFDHAVGEKVPARDSEVPAQAPLRKPARSGRSAAQGVARGVSIWHGQRGGLSISRCPGEPAATIAGMEEPHIESLRRS